MQKVITIDFNGQMRRVQAATSEIAIADLRGEYAELGHERNVDLSTLTVECVTGIDTYPTWDEFDAQFKPVTNHLDPNASYGGHMFQTYCDERKFAHAQSLEHVWTIAEDYSGDLTWIRPGFYWINSIGHFITAYPWRKGQAKFLG